MDDYFYVYSHIDPITREVFYIGKGSGYRVFERGKDSPAWRKRVLACKGFLFDIIKSGLTEKEALKLEKETIKMYEDNHPGQLVNASSDFIYKELNLLQRLSSLEKQAQVLYDWKSNSTEDLTDEEYKEYLNKINRALRVFNLDNPSCFNWDFFYDFKKEYIAKDKKGL